MMGGRIRSPSGEPPWGARVALLAIAVAVMSAASRAEGDPQKSPTYHFYRGARRVPLKLDVTRLALLNTTGGADSMSNLSGVSNRFDESLPLHGWSVPFIDTLFRTDQDVLRIVDSASAALNVDFVSPVFLSDSGGPVIVTPVLLVGFKPDITDEDARRWLDRFAAGEVLDRNWAGMSNVYRTRSTARSGLDVLQTANLLAESGLVLFAEPDFIFTGRGAWIPNDPLFSMSWGLHNTGQSGGAPDADLDAPEAWDITWGSAAQVVAVIDTGVDPAHPDLNLAPGYDTTDDGPSDGRPLNSFDNHGTPVAGCVSARIDNGLGTSGIAPGCRVASIRAFRTVNPNGGWVTQSSWTVEALNWAEANGVRITNNSNAYDFATAAIDTKYAQTRENGMIHFSSVHNDGEEVITYPAILPSVNAVAAVDRYGQRPVWGNYGPGVDFAAPGEEIVSTDRSSISGYGSGDYVIGSGTSFASPLAAGVAGLILARNPGLPAQIVEQILVDTCVDLGTPGYDIEFGAGMVNAAAATAMADPSVSGACCSEGICLGAIPAFQCAAAGGGNAGGRWFAGQSCGDVSCPPRNTRCELAETISDNGEFTFDNSNLTSLQSPDYGCGIADFHDGTVWFKFTATQTSVRLHTCLSTATDSTFAVYNECGELIEIGCGEDDQTCASSPYLSDQCIRGLTPGWDYFIQFSAWSSGDRGTFTLSAQAPCPPAAPLPEPAPIAKNRSLALWIAPFPTAAPTAEGALRITLLDLQNPSPANNPGSPPPNFSAYESGPTCSDPNGCVRWVGMPFPYLEQSSNPQSESFRAARLQCTPHYHNWSGEGLFHVIGAEIMPSSTYDVQLVPIECAGAESTCPSISAPLHIATGRFGDVASPFNPPSTSTQPDSLDIVALVDRFRSVPNSPSKLRAQLQPNNIEPNKDVDALDIVAGLDAFRGYAYPFNGPCPCPSTVVCNAAPCAAPGACPNGTCVRTCLGGSKDGNPCEDDANCPQGICATGFCRDRCKRCTP